MLGDIDETSNAEQLLEPQITSSDPNERKLARRLRIERRWEAVKKSKQGDYDSEISTEELTPVQIQLQKSAEILQKFLIEGEEYITNVRIANDSREVDRRENEGINREKIYEQLDEESESAQELFNNIAEKWASIQNHNDPLQINEDIMEQKEKCDMLISQKDAIIAMLNEELKKAERTFTKDQVKQNQDINTLAQRIEKQITFMRKAYRHELNIMEEVILKERENLIDSTDKKWEELFCKRENQEISNTDKKFEQLEEFNARMDQLRTEFQDYYRETKIKLENDIEELQIELEKIRALALLNSEKLDYNYQILKKREDENIIIKSQQKRRMNKLQDFINNLRGKITEYETNTTNQIKKLSDNIKKLHKSILDVDAKADRFARVNDEKFHMVWEMNRQRVHNVLKRILDTDRILYEQQMGIDWEPPPNFVVEKKALLSYKLALTTLSSDNIIDAEKYKSRSAAKNQKGDRPSLKGVRDETLVLPDETSSKNYQRVIKHILEKISDKSGFLAERRLKTLLKGYEDEQKHLVRLDNVFKALGIEGASNIDMLFKHFQPYTFCPTCQGSMVVSSAKLDGKDSTCVSQVYSMYSKIGEAETVIPELVEVMEAVRQPDAVFDIVVSDLVTTVDLYDELKSAEPSYMEGVEDICGGANLEVYREKDKDKAKGTSARIRLSRTNINVDMWQCQYKHSLVISSVYILKALREFVTSYYVKNVGLPTTGSRLEKKRLTISRLLSEADMNSYWEKFKLNFGEDRVRVWKALLVGLKKYHDILKDRKNICNEVLRLRKENTELKRLLANYLDHHEFLPASCAKERENSILHK
ncbi:dynein regulatory complex protein 1 homolog [Sitophilus oryzae]|uniref:Dynein regulatory complex protein 1 homolog n=1 Tax=Sitophilus oryzae TaxID=7048 RepID=A0A6J2XJ15_SITOR|nr:dynein regulatory complex protein 1 homolog [Sitophilus oryzae]